MPNDSSFVNSLPYLNFYKNSESARDKKITQGVTIYNSNASYDGYNVFNNEIFNMSGDKLYSLNGLSPGIILSNGDEIFVIKNTEINDPIQKALLGTSLVKTSKDGKIIWKIDEPAHHDISFYNNLIYVLSGEIRNYSNGIIKFDLLKIYDLNGMLIDSWSTYEHLDEIKKYHNYFEYIYRDIKLERDYTFMNLLGLSDLKKEGKFVADYYHTNYIHIIQNNSLSSEYPAFREGNILLSLSLANLIIILDKDSKEIIWHYMIPSVNLIHGPQVLVNGNILFFNNGFKRNHSSVIEFNPITEKIIWSYEYEDFYSEIMAFAQRLPNGNTLITESTKGHVFEVTPEKEIVWEWYNYYNFKDKMPNPVYRIMRYSKEDVERILNNININSSLEYLKY